MEFTGPKPTGPSRQSKPVTERRHSVRLVVHSPAYTSLDGSSPDKARDLSEIVDVSEGGMSIQTSSPLEVDRNLNLCLDLSETKTRIGTTGRVVWSNGSGRAGIAFCECPDCLRSCPWRDDTSGCWCAGWPAQWPPSITRCNPGCAK